TTRGGLMSLDRAAVAQAMRRHEWVTKLLDMGDISRTRSRAVSTIAGLRTFIEGRVSKVLLMRISEPWRGAEVNVLDAEEALALEALSERMWVQARPQGRRMRVLATPEKSWLVTTKAET